MNNIDRNSMPASAEHANFGNNTKSLVQDKISPDLIAQLKNFAQKFAEISGQKLPDIFSDDLSASSLDKVNEVPEEAMNEGGSSEVLGSEVQASEDLSVSPFDTANERNQEINPGAVNSEDISFEVVSDDAAGTIFTSTGQNGQEVKAEVNEDNHLLINGEDFGEVDDDVLTFNIKDGQVSVLHDGKALEGFTPIDLGKGAEFVMGLDDVQGNSQKGTFTVNGETIEASNKVAEEALVEFAEVQNSVAAAPGTENIAEYDPTRAPSFEGDMTFSDYLSTLMKGDAFGLDQQKFQYGGYDSSDVKTLNNWEDVLATGVVRENEDGSVTLSTSESTPRVQFYPDDDVPGGREPTAVSDLQDTKFGFSIDGWTEGEAAWIYEHHKVGDGQAMAIGFNQQGNLMLANGETTETDISLVDASGVAIDYTGSTANVSVLNADGSVRGTESIEVSGDEVLIKGIELYNRRAAADTEVSATFNQISFGNNGV